MPTVISIDDQYAIEESTACITVTFTDENGDEAIPSSITWTFTDEDGNIINSRNQVAIGAPAATNNIVLSGDDLAIQAGETGDSMLRIFTVEAVYSSDLGADLPLKDSLKFPLVDLVAI